ncbi:Hydroquinone glucosyltransferase [Bertholletia excelsa]
MARNPLIVFVPTPGMGHLIPLAEFARPLVHRHGFAATFVVPTDAPLPQAQKSFLDSIAGAGISHVILPPADVSDLPDDARIETRISLVTARSLPALLATVKSLKEKSPVVALVADLFGTDAFDVAGELKIPRYIFFPSTAMCLSLFLYLPKLDASVSGEYRDQSEPIRIPGCHPIHGSELLDPVQERGNDAYKWILHHTKRYRMAEGIVVNSFRELEPGAVKALQEDLEPNMPRVYPVGPLIRGQEDGLDLNAECECLRWLDQQPSGSVLFVAFGSGGTLKLAQLRELAAGLELSEQRFLWIVKGPSDGAANAEYFSLSSRVDPLAFLPDGFLERTKGVGLVVPTWAPQAQILSHGSTGGFLSHCGWNSTLESVVNGMPMIAWPLYAEQKMNAAMLTEEIKVALRPRANEDGLVGRVEIARVVKGLMEGEEGKRLRSRTREIKEAATRVLSDGGTSPKALAELSQKWKENVSEI